MLWLSCVALCVPIVQKPEGCASRPAKFPQIPVVTPPAADARKAAPVLATGSLPAKIEWSALLATQLDPSRWLPKPTADELRASNATDLLDDAERLAAWSRAGAVKNLGDALMLLRRGDRAGVRALAKELKKSGAPTDAFAAKALEAFADDEALFGADWEILQSGGRTPFWEALEGRRLVLQAITVVLASYDETRRAERDYAAHLRAMKSDLIDLYPVAGGYVFGDDPRGRPFAFVRSWQMNDLPWPYANFPCELRTLEHEDERGRFVTDSYSTSSDFYWLAGRDTYVPVCTSNGEFAGYLLVTSFGMDVRGVPDSRGDMADQMRANLRFIRKTAERRD